MSEIAARLARLLVAEGAEYAFGITGSGPSLTLISELERNGARYFDVPHEAAAAIMAGTVARRTSRPSVSISIKGPGFTNMLPGIAHNRFESNPAVSISEAYGPAAPATRQHKRLDQASIIKPVVKAVAGAASSEKELRCVIRSASREAPGPVHFELAEGATGVMVEDAPGRSSTHALGTLLGKIATASRPVVIAGSLGLRRQWRDSLRSLRIPVFTTTSAKGLVDEAGESAAGVYTGDGKKYAPEQRLIAASDLVVCIGVRGSEVLSPWSHDVEVIGIDEIEPATGFPFSVFQVAEENDVSNVIEALQSKEWGAELVQAARADLEAVLSQKKWLPFHCFRQLQSAGHERILVTDTGSFCTIAEHAWQASEKFQYVGSSNGRYMGVGLPMAVAIALQDTATPVVCAVGDGGMRMYPAVLKLAVEARAPLCIVFMRDSRYGSIAAAATQTAYSANALAVVQPSWVAAIGGLGVDSVSVFSENEFAEAMSAWRSDRPLFIEAVFDPDAYLGMTAGIR